MLLLSLAFVAGLPSAVRAQGFDLIFAGGFQAPPAASAARQILLTANATLAPVEQVNLGIPFPPGVLTDAGRVRILDAAGNEVAAFVKPVLHWHWLDGSIRAVKVQFFADPAGQYRFDFSQPRGMSIDEQPYDNGTRPGTMGAPVPRLIATLEVDWLVRSGIAGPQSPRDTGRAYDQFVDRQWQWARDTDYSVRANFLFDRAGVIGLQYVRNGDPEYFAEFYNSATFYLSHIKTTGNGSGCTGGWEFGGSPCDTKYSYLTPQLLLLALAGDDTRISPATLQHMIDNTLQGGWGHAMGPYPGGFFDWTERHTGLGLDLVVVGYEITGDPAIGDRVRDIVGWLYDHQQAPPPGDVSTGAWNHSWQAHEGLPHNPVTDVRGGSPWMSANIIGGLWRAWRVTGDSRIPVLMRAFGHYLDQHGFVPDHLLPGSGWRASCNADGVATWYFSSGTAPESAVLAIQQSNGGGVDSHNPELFMVMAAAYYFEFDPVARATFLQRGNGLARYFNVGCGAVSHTARAFNWQHRNPEALWLFAH